MAAARLGKAEKVAFQGAAGAYSDLACRHLYPGRPTLPCPSFEDAFAAVDSGEAALAVIPVENSLAGRVADVHHLLPRWPLFIVAEHFEPIRHALLGVPGAKLGDLKYVLSHVHAIPQCRKIIKTLKLKAIAQGDTAGAARDVAEKGDPAYGAIASSLAADIYGLKILQNDVQDEDHNTTRFIVLAPAMTLPPRGAKKNGEAVVTSLTFRVRNMPAALYKALGGFATNGLSLTKLESYVDPSFQAAEFYCEVEGHPQDPAMVLALDELSFFAESHRLLGAYRAHPFRLKESRL